MGSHRQQPTGSCRWPRVPSALALWRNLGGAGTSEGISLTVLDQLFRPGLRVETYTIHGRNQTVAKSDHIPSRIRRPGIRDPGYFFGIPLVFLCTHRPQIFRPGLSMETSQIKGWNQFVRTMTTAHPQKDLSHGFLRPRRPRRWRRPPLHGSATAAAPRTRGMSTATRPGEQATASPIPSC